MAEAITEDLKRFDVPTLLLHGEDDQIVPVENTARKSEKLIKEDLKANRRLVGVLAPTRFQRELLSIHTRYCRSLRISRSHAISQVTARRLA
jgi:predicted esterase